jgi:hypothetical protein
MTQAAMAVQPVRSAPGIRDGASLQDWKAALVEVGPQSLLVDANAVYYVSTKRLWSVLWGHHSTMGVAGEAGDPSVDEDVGLK